MSLGPSTAPGSTSADVPQSPARARLDLLDGLRGVAIVLVVLSHTWQLWPVDLFDEHWVIRPLVRSGNTAVTVFLVVSGFLTYRALSGRGGGRAGLAGMQPEVTLLRRLVRVAPSLWLMLAVLMLVALVDPTDTTAWSDNRDSVWHVVTYTWNWYVQGNLLSSRPDLGHLWYLSVDMQAFVVMALFLLMFRRRPIGVLFGLAGFWLLLTWWRFHVSDVEFVLQVLVRTTARMDAFVLGVLVGAAVAALARVELPRAELRGAAALSALALVPLSWWTAADPLGDGDTQFLHWGGTVLQLDLAVLVGALALGARTPVTDLLGRPILVRLGEHSLLLYIWHYPVFVLVERHSGGWPWALRGLVAFAVTAAVCVLAHRLVERRVVALLRRPGWRELDDGLPAYLRARGRRFVESVRPRRTSGSSPPR